MFLAGSYATRQVACLECKKLMMKGEPLLKGVAKKRFETGTRTYVFFWHLECWLVQVKRYLDEHPYIDKAARLGGRPSLGLKPFEYKVRRSIQRRLRIIAQRKEFAAFHLLWSQLEELKAEERILLKQLEEVSPHEAPTTPADKDRGSAADLVAKVS